MSTSTELLQVASLAVGLVTVLGGAIWWLVAPRVTAFLRELAGLLSDAGQQLDDSRPGSTASHAATAAKAAVELPQLRTDLAHVREQVEQLTAAQLVPRLDLVELMQERHEQRLSSIEQLQLQLVAAGFIPTHRPPHAPREDDKR